MSSESIWNDSAAVPPWSALAGDAYSAPVDEAQACTARAARPLPHHIGFIPDGNRRWAVLRGMAKQADYAHGIGPGLALFERFRETCAQFALEIERRGAALLAVGDERSPVFPPQLQRFRQRQGRGIKVNFLVNYGWVWDLDGLRGGELRSADVSRLDLAGRWGG